jgi:hypothetical protein
MMPSTVSLYIGRDCTGVIELGIAAFFMGVWKQVYVCKTSTTDKSQRIKDNKAIEVCYSLIGILGGGVYCVGEECGLVAEVRGGNPGFKSEGGGAEIVEVGKEDTMVSEEESMACSTWSGYVC